MPLTVIPGGGLFVLQNEESQNAYLLLIGYTPSLDAEARHECVALFTVRKVVQSVFGYPNEEAYWHDPRGEIATRVVEIVGSKWADENRLLQRTNLWHGSTLAADASLLSWLKGHVGAVPGVGHRNRSAF
jgi:hypothetical protein